MSREIRYRAWDKRFNKMVDIETIDFRVQKLYYRSGYRESTIINFKHAELLEYIGLRDRNGREIAEADILRESDGRIYFIVWAEDEARFELENAQDHSLRHIKDVRIMTIIGDTWQNPDLLEGAE